MDYRVELDHVYLKRVVVTGGVEWKLKIHEGGGTQDVLSEAELVDLYAQRHLAEYVNQHLNGREVDFLPASVRLLNHRLHFLHIRDEPFVLLERVSKQKQTRKQAEPAELPRYIQTYFDKTEWDKLCKHGPTIVEHFAAHIEELEQCKTTRKAQ